MVEMLTFPGYIAQNSGLIFSVGTYYSTRPLKSTLWLSLDVHMLYQLSKIFLFSLDVGPLLQRNFELPSSSVQDCVCRSVLPDLVRSKWREGVTFTQRFILLRVESLALQVDVAKLKEKQKQGIREKKWDFRSISGKSECHSVRERW